jgi:hypothetical protein
MVPDTNFIAAFANNPLTLSILIIGVVLGLTIWKISPFFKDLISRIDTGNKDVREQLEKIVLSDNQQVEDIKDIKEHVRLNTLDILRMTIYNEQVDIKDRLVAAKRYFMRNGNGKVAAYVKILVDQNHIIWDTILATMDPKDVAIIEHALEIE